MYYIFIVNDFPVNEDRLAAEDIVKKLFARGYWLYTENTPFAENYAPGDKAVVYVAGIGRRYFSGSFEIAGSVAKNDLQPADKYEKELFSFFTLASPITAVEKWKEPVYFDDLIGELSFINHKDDMALLIKQSAKLISKEDYQLILDKAK